MWKSWRTAKKLRVQIISLNWAHVYMHMSTLTQCLQTQAHENSDNHTRARTHVTVLCTLAPLHRSHFTATPEIKFLWQRRAAEEDAREEEKDGRETIDRLELAQSGIELYQKRRASQQEAFWFVSKGENRGMFALYSSFASLIHFHFSFHPQPCLFKEFFLAFFGPPPPPPSWLLHLSLSPFVFTPLSLPASFFSLLFPLLPY